MTGTLATTALLLGLAGSPHCAVMCGALQAGAAQRGGVASLGGSLALQLGRLVGYAAAGAAVAASAGALARLGDASSALRPVWTMLQVGAFAFGLALLLTGRVPAWLGAWRAARRGATLGAATIRFVARVPATARAAGAGVCWVALPCGLLQSALIVAALASGPAEGGFVMAAFAAGSSAGLLIVGTLWRRLGGAGAVWARPTLPVRLAGLLLAGAAAWALWHGLGAAIEQALCA